MKRSGFSLRSVCIPPLFAVVVVVGCVDTQTADGPRIPGGATAATPNGSGQTVPTSDGTTTAGSSDARVIPASVTDGCQIPVEADGWATEVLRLTNQERVQRGLDPVVWNPTLALEATDYACELITFNYFAHVNPETGESLRDRAAAVNYEYWEIGENLAGGQTTPAQAVREWMDSPDHRENILNPDFTELGIGVRLGGDYRIYWVQEFGRPLSEGPAPK